MDNFIKTSIWRLCVLALVLGSGLGLPVRPLAGKLSPEEKVTNEKQGLKYLMNFGYLECIPNTLEYKDPSPKPKCTPEDIEQAIADVQKMFGIKTTKKLDRETLDKMNLGRCGDKDTRAREHINKLLVGGKEKSSRSEKILPLAAFSSRTNSGEYPSNKLNNDTSRSEYQQNSESSKLYEDSNEMDDSKGEDVLDYKSEKSTRVRRGSLRLIDEEKSSAKNVFHIPTPTLQLRESIKKEDSKIVLDRVRSRILEEKTHEESKSRKKRNVFEDLVNNHKMDVLRRRRMSKTRRRRSLAGDGGEVVHYIIPDNSKKVPKLIVSSELQMAMMTWSKVIPHRFREASVTEVVSRMSDYPEIEISFFEGNHGCSLSFDGKGRTLAHTVGLQSLMVVHFDDAEHFGDSTYGTTSSSDYPISLYHVAAHEIGHILGLEHTTDENSIMNPIYNQSDVDKYALRLSEYDRRAVQAIHGVCKGTFDAILDWLELWYDGDPAVTAPTVMFRTYFYRDNHFWNYDNQNNQTQPDDPRPLAEQMSGLPTGTQIDAVVQIPVIVGRCQGGTSNVVQDVVTYIFAGENYYSYDNNLKAIDSSSPKRINEHFRSKLGGAGVPSNLDTVFYDFQMNEIYFFKDQSVWIYDACQIEKNACCTETKASFSDHFVMSPSSRKSVYGNIDTIYYLYSTYRTFLFKGEDVYEMQIVDYRKWVLTYIGPWYETWNDICDV